MTAFLTLGHSTLPAERFIELLRLHGVTAVCDVRSQPFSRWNPHYNRKVFEQTLADNGIAYTFLGRELGGRPEDPACYENGRVQYERLACTVLFDEGMRRLEEEASKRRVAIVCAEKDPVDCHRALLVGREAQGRGWSVSHILQDGSIESQEALIERLNERLGNATGDLFCG